MNADSPETLSFRSDSPVIIADLASDERFREATALRDHDISSSLLVRIDSSDGPLGVLGAHGKKGRAYEQDDVNFLHSVANVVAAAISRKRDEDRVAEYGRTLEARVNERTSWLSLLHDVTRAANEADSLEQAILYALDRIGRHGGQSFGQAFLGSKEVPDKFVMFRNWSVRGAEDLRKFREATRLVCLRLDTGLLAKAKAYGTAVHSRHLARDLAPDQAAACGKLGLESVLVIRMGSGDETVGLLEFFSEEAREFGEAYLDLMSDVGTQLGRAVERMRFQEGFAGAVWREQQRIAQEIHDGLGQELAGLGFMSRSLAGQLQQESSEGAQAAQRLTDGIQRAMEKASALARGILPVEVDDEGLMAALGRLAATTASLHGVSCTFECESPVLLHNDVAAWQLFRIAQEAVTNAIRHAQARTIVISLGFDDGRVRLEVRDDGVGIGIGQIGRSGTGLGLRIMRHRASAIGATITISPGRESGTVVKCVLPEVGNETQARKDRQRGRDSP